MMSLYGTISLEQKNVVDNEYMKTVVSKYINKIPDIKTQYVINEGLSKAISHYFNGKVNTFPLYKISLSIDRNPVKIPWTLGQPNKNGNIKKRVYRYLKPNSVTLKIKDS